MFIFGVWTAHADPCPLPKSANVRHVSIRTDGGRWPGVINHVFLFF